ncbi:uncharacterized protein LOC133307175 [Gastrolobium bilobum]|uniref:uncharacterized protein LOC133307175 n=1 Tax=Gastrolobium bilobum TaxID=150636 RepID=UPI002AB0EBA0|nr:uncharacterized protein LOC133307175 [Gastrolobium bilobum]
MRVQEVADEVASLHKRLEESQNQIALLVAQMQQMNDSMVALQSRSQVSQESQQESVMQSLSSEGGNFHNDRGNKEVVDPRSLLKFVKMEIPLFDGTNPDNWIFKIELFFDLQRVPPELKVQLAGLRMDGTASSLFQWKFRSGTVRSWTDFVTALCQCFGVLPQKHVTGNLSKLSQQGTKKGPYRAFHSNETTSGTITGLATSVASNAVSSTANTSSAVPKIPFRKLSNEEMSRKRELGLCFTCDDKWTSKHRCPSKMLLMVGEDLDEDGEEEENMVWNSQGLVKEDAALHSLSGGTFNKAFQFLAHIHGKAIPILVDTRSTHNFVKTELANELGLHMTRIKRMRVFLGNGEFMLCDHKCREVHMWIHGEEFVVDLWVLNLEKLDLILGICWLEQLGKVTHDYHQMEMEFKWKDKDVQLTALKTTADKELIQHDQAEYWAMQQEAPPSTTNEVSAELLLLKPTVNELLWPILLQYQSVFTILRELPPFRDTVHAIHLEQGVKPVNVRPYCYGHHQKEEIEKQVSDLLESGFIKPSNSPYSSPILLVKKQDNSWRICMDYRALNKITIRDRFPMPTIDELMDELDGSAIFSKLDLRAGYH